MKEKIKKTVIATILGIIIIALCSLTIYNNFSNKNNNQITNQEQENNNEATILNGISCGNNCQKYENIEIEKKYLLNYINENISISIEVYNDFEYEKSKLIISTNNNQIYKIVDFTNNYKIFKFNNIYVVEYSQSQSQCGNKIDILIDSDGSLIGIPANEFNDTFISEDLTLTPALMKTEFIESANTIIAYKEICSMCSNNDNQIGFKYTYKLENKTLILTNKDTTYCKQNKN